MALCVAFQQRTKNAWRIHDRAAIERNWRLALDAARHALILDPHNDQARYQVTDLERRLHDLRASQRQAAAQAHSVPPAESAGL
jgi:hypothetical protein